jgi:hypothetical protein
MTTEEVKPGDDEWAVEELARTLVLRVIDFRRRRRIVGGRGLG